VLETTAMPIMVHDFLLYFFSFFLFLFIALTPFPLCRRCSVDMSVVECMLQYCWLMPCSWSCMPLSPPKSNKMKA
jgi:hypothetical protein